MRKNDPRFSVENRKIMQDIIGNDFKPVAEKYGLSITQLSVAALISQGGVVALCGARDESQVTENAKAGDPILEQGDINKIRESLASINF
ncbi:MAG: hypothetical protein U5N58_05765 [Actinomycetota bacterium]|nr:hypothetical protein [Actinomycetota bacterium]